MARKEIKHRQVIVIGAGPAGAACAQRLAEDGVDVVAQRAAAFQDER